MEHYAAEYPNDVAFANKVNAALVSDNLAALAACRGECLDWEADASGVVLALAGLRYERRLERGAVPAPYAALALEVVAAARARERERYAPPVDPITVAIRRASADPDGWRP